MSEAESTTVRCTACRAEFTDTQIEGATACPKCGATGLPMAIAQDVTLRINWHELRILTIWADNWARARCPASSQATLASIIRELEKQRPDGFPALTLAGEVRDMQRAGVDVEMRDGTGNVVVPPRGKPS